MAKLDEMTQEKDDVECSYEEQIKRLKELHRKEVDELNAEGGDKVSKEKEKYDSQIQAFQPTYYHQIRDAISRNGHDEAGT